MLTILSCGQSAGRVPGSCLEGAECDPHPFRSKVIVRRAWVKGQLRGLPSSPQSALTLDPADNLSEFVSSFPKVYLEY